MAFPIWLGFPVLAHGGCRDGTAYSPGGEAALGQEEKLHSSS